MELFNEESLPSCGFLSSAILKQMTALNIYGKETMPFVDFGQIYSLIHRSFDLLFHASIQQNKNGHILKSNKKFIFL